MPADAVLHSVAGLWVDESLLTGESLPVEKQVSTDGARAGVRRHRLRQSGADYQQSYGRKILHGGVTATESGVMVLCWEPWPPLQPLCMSRR